MAQTEYTTEVLADSPAVFYKLDEVSGLPQDSSGNLRHMVTPSGTPEYRYSSPFSGAFGIRMNGESFVRSPPVSTVTDNLAVELWINPELFDSGGASFFQNGSGSGNGVEIGISASSKKFYINVDGTDPQEGRWAQNVGWIHVAVVRRSSVWEWYFNGDLWMANAGNGSVSTPTGSTRIASSTPSFTLSNLSFYGTALSAIRIRAHYEAAIDYIERPLAIPAIAAMSW